jgi:hypothetical protein
MTSEVLKKLKRIMHALSAARVTKCGALWREAIDMTPLGFIPALLPDLWGTTSGFINGMLRLGSVAAFASLPSVYNDIGGGGGDLGDGSDGSGGGGGGGGRGGGTRAVFWCVAAVGALMCPLALVVRHVAVGRADALLGVIGGGPGGGGTDTTDREEKLEDEEKRTMKEAVEEQKKEEKEEEPVGGMAAAAYASARRAVVSVPRRFWAYAAAGTAMYSSVIPFWFYGSGFLQRSHGFSVAEADSLMVRLSAGVRWCAVISTQHTCVNSVTFTHAHFQ